MERGVIKSSGTSNVDVVICPDFTTFFYIRSIEVINWSCLIDVSGRDKVLSCSLVRNKT